MSHSTTSTGEIMGSLPRTLLQDSTVPDLLTKPQNPRIPNGKLSLFLAFMDEKQK